MDYELVDMGCSRLAESTVEERETATEKVLKNLKEHGGYYSALIQFEGGMNQAGKIDESSFTSGFNTDSSIVKSHSESLDEWKEMEKAMPSPNQTPSSLKYR